MAAGVRRPVDGHGLAFVVTQIKRDTVRVTGIADIDDRAAIRRDGGCITVLIGEVRPVCKAVGQRCRAGNTFSRRGSFGLGAQEGLELFVVGILSPVGHGIVNRCRIPDSVKNGVRFRGDTGDDFAIRGPAPTLKSITGTRRLRHFGKAQRLPTVDVSGSHSAAALGVKCDPIAVHALGCQSDIGCDCRTCGKRGAAILPAGNTLFGGLIILNLGRPFTKRLVGLDAYRAEHVPFGRQKRDIVAVGEHGIDPNGRVFAGQSGDRTEGNHRIPAGKHLAGLCLDLRLQQRVAILHDLRVHFFVIDIKFIGIVGGVACVR